MLGLVGRSSSTHIVDLTGFDSQVRNVPSASYLLAIALFAVLLSLAVTGD